MALKRPDIDDSQRNLVRNERQQAPANSPGPGLSSLPKTAQQFLALLLSVNDFGFLLVAMAMFLAELLIVPVIIQRIPCK
jgi:hypothetical protein